MRISAIVRNFCSNGSSRLITTERFKSVSIISLNRPDKQNALNKRMLTELADHLNKFEEDDKISAAILNGIGSCFSIGYDIDELKDNFKQNEQINRDHLILPFHRKTSKPLICSISGACKSIGFELALMCDLRYIETNTVFHFSNRYLGIPLMNNGPLRLAKFIGLLKATEIILNDKEINATDALQLGLASEMFPDGTALGQAVKNAVHFSSVPQSALKYDLNNLNKFRTDEELENELWQSISIDVKNNINHSKETLKVERVAKLKNMPEWELDEVRRENEYLARNSSEITKTKSTANS